MGKGKNSRAASSKKVIEEDEERVLKVIENKEFLAMRTVASTWPVLTTKEEQLKELNGGRLVSNGFLISILVRLFFLCLLFVLACAFLLLLFFIVSLTYL
jgi:hypothetical protein